MTTQKQANYFESVKQFERSGDKTGPVCHDCGKLIAHPCHGLDSNHCGESAHEGHEIVRDHWGIDFEGRDPATAFYCMTCHLPLIATEEQA